ncbi:HlyD family secretion protein [Pedobacter rhizosphaerae]|uniref:Membrane fusion protein, multidrug efflux system n=1 Tax=Pedobacter rhizosphaerae TaxID=390241 RepID=A0A1H9VYP0_9SPHI|nr:HlyD family secretion protein [Pedobacter rhizosphaerae]SES26880.1 membrane fusion protein, multidrug efflux system [Pedobacter rhizosphaerae]
MSTHKQSKTDQAISRITTITALIVLVVLLVWGGKTVLSYMKYEETNDAQIDEYINPVTARVSGYVKEVRFEENQEVKKGDTLVLIDDDDYTVQQDEAAASLLNAEAQVAVQQSNIRTAQAGAAVSSAKIASAKAKLWKQQAEYDRYKKLYDAESATRQQLETIESLLQVAQAEYQAAKEDYAAALSKTNDIKAQSDVLQSEIKRRQAVVKRNNLNTSYTVILAPYDGKMGRRTIQPGQLVQNGQTLAYIVDRSQGKWVVANFKETQIARMHVGEEVSVEIDAFPNVSFTGKIESLSGATGSRFSLLPPDNSTGNFVKIAQRIPVRIRLAAQQVDFEKLNAGMSAIVKVKKND